MGLGSLDTFNLAEARERARLVRQQIANGIDPIDARQAEGTARRLDALSRKTFKQCAEEYVAAPSAYRPSILSAATLGGVSL